MRDANEHIEIVGHEHGSGDHSLAVGIVAGAALGVGFGLLLAPRKGSELREQITVRATRAANTASHGYHVVADACHGTTRYIGRVSSALTMKAGRPAKGPATPIAITQPTHA